MSLALGTHSCEAERAGGQQSCRPSLSPMQPSLELTASWSPCSMYSGRTVGGPGRGFTRLGAVPTLRKRSRGYDVGPRSREQLQGQVARL